MTLFYTFEITKLIEITSENGSIAKSDSENLLNTVLVVISIYKLYLFHLRPPFVSPIYEVHFRNVSIVLIHFLYFGKISDATLTRFEFRATRCRRLTQQTST